MKQSLLELLYKERAPVIHRYLMKSGCPAQDAEDIVQEVFCRAAEYMAELSEENISAWLFRVAINRWYDLCRREKKRPVISIDIMEFSQHLGQEEDGEALLLKREENERIKIILDKLPDTQKNLLLLKYDMDLSYEKIGALLNMNAATVKTYLYRARKTFQKEWENQSIERRGD